jgi:hypothetical protein
MSSQPIHASTPSSCRGVIRYSLCLLVVAVALASGLDCGCALFLMVARRIFHYGYGYPGQFQVFYGAAPVFLLVAVALIAWRFRKRTKTW